VSISKHFCGDYLADVQVFSAEKKTCKCSLFKKEATDKGCCKDEIKVAKLSISQLLAKVSAFNFLKFATALVPPFISFSFAKTFSYISLFSWEIETFFPPPKSSLYLFFCVFRI
jgi:hypothetical protein